MASLVLVGVWAWTRNLRTGGFTWDEDEVVYFDLARIAAEQIYRLDLVGLLSELSTTFRPPLLVLSDALVLLLMRPDPALLATVRVAWLGLLLWGVAGLLRDLLPAELPGRRRTVAVALLLVATTPVLLQLGTSLMSEVPLAAVGVLAVRLMLRLSEAPSWPRAGLAGLAIGAGLLMKWTFPVVLVGPVVVLIWRDGLSRLGWWAAAGGVAAAVAAPWYVASLEYTVPFLLDVSVGEGATAYGAAQRSWAQEVGYYPLALAGGIFWLPVAALVAAGGVRAVLSDPGRRLPLAAAALVPPLLYSLLANKEIRYVVPAVPFAAALGAIGLVQLAEGRRWLLGATLGLVGLGWLGGLPTQGMEPRNVEESLVGPLRIEQDPGAGLPALPTQAGLKTPFGELTLWSRGDLGFKYRRAVPEAFDPAVLDGLVQQLNPGGRREAAVMNPAAWLWTPLWAESRRRNGWTVWRATQCDPLLVDEATFFLALEPLEPPTQHCRETAEEARASFERLRPKLRRLQRWSVDGRTLSLWVHKGRLYPNQPAY